MKKDRFYCQIVSPRYFAEYHNVLRLYLPTPKGVMEVMAYHAETFTLLAQGEMVIVLFGKEKKKLKINQGECHIQDNKVFVIL